MMNPFSYDFFVDALLCALLTGVITGIIGSYITARRMLFVAGGVTHSSFAGLGLGFYLGWSPLTLGVLSAVISGLSVDYLSHKGSAREDSAVAAVWSLGMALGVLFLFMTPGYAPSLSTFLFGNILLTTPRDLVFLSLFLLFSLVFVIGWYRTLLYVSFDREFLMTKIARRVRLYESLMMIWYCVGIVLSIRVLGIMMLMSMLSLPQLTVSLFTEDFKQLMIFSALLSALSVSLSLLGSFYFNLPTGALSVVFLSLLFVVTKSATFLPAKHSGGAPRSAIGRR